MISRQGPSLASLPCARREGGSRFVGAQSANQYLARDHLIGAKIPGKDGKIIGDVEDLIINDKNQVVGVVMGTGGFLGVAEKKVGVDLSALKFEEKDGHDTLPDGDQAAIGSAPAFQRTTAREVAVSSARARRSIELSDKTTATTKDAIEKAKPVVEQAKEKAKEAIEQAKPALENATEKAKDAIDAAKEAAAPAIEKAKEAAGEALDAAKEAAKEATTPRRRHLPRPPQRPHRLPRQLRLRRQSPRLHRGCSAGRDSSRSGSGHDSAGSRACDTSGGRSDACSRPGGGHASGGRGCTGSTRRRDAPSRDAGPALKATGSLRRLFGTRGPVARGGASSLSARGSTHRAHELHEPAPSFPP